MEVKTIEVANVKTETLKNLENVRPLPSTSLTPSPKGKARQCLVLRGYGKRVYPKEEEYPLFNGIVARRFFLL